MLNKIETTRVTPNLCPACNFDLSTVDMATMTAHFLAHLAVTLGPGNNRDSTSDW